MSRGSPGARRFLWSAESIDKAVSEIRRSRTIKEAIQRTQAALGWPVSHDSIMDALKRAKKPTMGNLLMPPLLGSEPESVPPQFKNLAADLSDLEWDDDYETNPVASVVAAPVLTTPIPGRDRPEPYKAHVSDDIDCWLIWSDAHIPFEDKRAFDLVLEVGRYLKPYGQIIIGDFADMLSVSSHPKTPQQARWQLKDEVFEVNERLDQLDALDCIEKHYFAGNHCIRGQRMASNQMIGLFDSLDPAELFKLKERGWQYYPYQKYAKIGKVFFVHDSGFAGKYAVHHNGSAFESSTVQGHTHAAGVVYFGNVIGERHVSAVVGWLGSDEYVDYMASIKVNRNWTKAFGLMWVEKKTQVSHVQVFPIIEYSTVVNGRRFST